MSEQARKGKSTMNSTDQTVAERSEEPALAKMLVRGSITRSGLIELLQAAYNLGSDACKYVNFKKGPGLAKSFVAKERSALNRLMRAFGEKRLTDDEYGLFAR